MPFRNNSFDVVTLLEVIEHVNNPMKMLNETYNVLKKKGIAIIITPNENSKLFKLILEHMDKFY